MLVDRERKIDGWMDGCIELSATNGLIQYRAFVLMSQGLNVCYDPKVRSSDSNYYLKKRSGVHS